MTHRMASDIFDLPLPLGPTIPVIGLSNVRRVTDGKDLKPCISRDFKYRTNTVLQLLIIVEYYTLYENT